MPRLLPGEHGTGHGGIAGKPKFKRVHRPTYSLPSSGQQNLRRAPSRKSARKVVHTYKRVARNQKVSQGLKREAETYSRSLRTARANRKLGAKPGSLGTRQLGDLFARHGLIEEIDYRDFAHHLWNRLAPYYGQKGKSMPTLSFGRAVKVPEGGSSAAYVDTRRGPGKRSVVVNPSGLFGARVRPGDKYARDFPSVQFSRSVPIHEWVHVFQTTPRGRRDIEGGAEAFKKAVSPKAHLHPPLAKDYVPYMRSVLRRHGGKWVLKGQFR